MKKKNDRNIAHNWHCFVTGNYGCSYELAVSALKKSKPQKMHVNETYLTLCF